jgi:Rrf2 family nitric oxide-sensitive transcriptional repressor
MKLTTFTDYSLRVLIYLAAQPERRTTIAEIANVFEVSEHHLVKVVHFLGQCGWLLNVRGRGGGLQLALQPQDINIGEVVRQTEGPAVVAECFGEAQSNCSIAKFCRLRGVLGEAVAAFNAVLDRYTLADLAQNQAQLAKVLFLHK